MIPSIQCLRGIAALMVLWFHSVIIDPFTREMFGESYWGKSGVDLFFVISGFVMVIATAGKPFAPQSFLTRRLVRLVPLYWLMTAVTVVAVWTQLTLKHYDISVLAIIKSVLFIPYGPSTKELWPIVLPGWTLNYEMFFYALFACSLWLPRKAQLPGLAIALVGLVSLGYLSGPLSNPLAYVYTNPLLLEFLCGVFIATAWRNKKLEVGRPIAVACLIVGLSLFLLREESGSLPSQLSGACLVIIGALSSNSGWSQNKMLLLLGNASYSIYLTHEFILSVLHGAWRHHVSGAPLWLAVPLVFTNLAVSLAVGLLVYWYVEIPLTARLRIRGAQRVVREQLEVATSG